MGHSSSSTPPERASQRVVVGIDVGGSKGLALGASRSGAVVGRATLEVPPPERGVGELDDFTVDLVRRAAHDVRPAAVGVAAAGFIDVERARVRFAPHLPWRDHPLKSRLEARLGVPVVLDNDANLALLAELRDGAARGSRRTVMIALGTGVGGALATDGVIERGANGMAGEIGHMPWRTGGRKCECGLWGCWEQYASGRALDRAARDRWGGRVTGRDISRAAAEGDDWAVGEIEAVGRVLGGGLASLAAAIDPDLFVIGGGLSALGELLLGPAREAMLGHLPGRDYRDPPRVETAELGPEAAAVGAAYAAWDLLDEAAAR